MSVSGIGSGTSTTASLGKNGTNRPDAVQDFLRYMKMTPWERMEAAWLRAHGYTKEQVDALPAEERQKLLDKMKQEIAEMIRRQTGLTGI
jgi:hypothetical protein